MKKRTPPIKKRETSKLKAQLALRERQFGLLVAGLKAILRFNSAHLSVFESEVHELQRVALRALALAEAARLGKALRETTAVDKRLQIKTRLSSLYGPFAQIGVEDGVKSPLEE